MADRFESIKRLLGAAVSVVVPSHEGRSRLHGKDFMRDDLTHGADYAG